MVGRMRNQDGDTIVEVIIAAAIVGLMLVVSFTIANASFKQIRMTQERGEAQRFAQSQVEQLDPLIKNNPVYLTSSPAGVPYPFCFDNSGTAYTAGANDCKQGTDQRYVISISHPPGAVNNTYFQVSVSWDGISGRSEKLTLDYKVGERQTNAP